jgi:hypothetical protein
VIGVCLDCKNLIVPPPRGNVIAFIGPPNQASLTTRQQTWRIFMKVVRKWPRALSARRLVLLATIASLGVAGAIAGPNGLHQLTHPTYSAASAAESMQRPVGFADLAAKVKPAVISVRVKVDAGAEMMDFDANRSSQPD